MIQILITSSVLILVMALARLVLRKRVSQQLIYGLWLLVALRLLIPVQFGQSKYSVTAVTQSATNQVQQAVSRPISGPSREEVYDQLVEDYLAQTPEEPETPAVPETPTVPEVTTPAIRPTVPAQVQTQLRQEAEAQVTAPSMADILTGIWIAGMTAMALWFLTANILFLRKIRCHCEPVRTLAWQSPEVSDHRRGLPRRFAPRNDRNIRVRICPHLDTPCLVGIFRPTVCLTPASIENEDTLRHVLAHETTHLRHGDHIWSLVRCICLCVYWFNPLVWLAAILSKRDQELACDEAALKKLGEEERIPYGKTLLTIVSHSMAPGKILQTATAMSETKKQLKERIEFIVKRPKNFWFAAISLILIAALTTGIVFTGCDSNNNSTLPSAETSEVSSSSTESTGITTEPSETGPTDPEPTDPPETNGPTEPSKPIFLDNAPDSALFGTWTAHVAVDDSILSYSLTFREDGTAEYLFGYYGSELIEKMEGTWKRTDDNYYLELTPVVIDEDTGALTYVYQGVYRFRCTKDGSLIQAQLKDGLPLFHYYTSPRMTLYAGDYYDIPIQYA